MTIYVDTLIFTNIIIDYLLLILTAKILKINFKYFRVVIASVAGGFSSLIILLPVLNFLCNLGIKTGITAILTFLAFGFNKFNIFFKRVFALFLVTMGFSGIILFLITAFESNFLTVNNSIIYLNISPILLIIFTVIAYFILQITEKIRFGKVDLIHKIKFIYDETEYSFLSRYDTCCNIKEPFSGGEVILVEKNLLDKLTVPNGKIRIIPFESLGGDGIIQGFLPQELYIDNNKIHRTVYIGITENIIKGEINSIFNYKNICE
ncbi:MAG: sigma-E processing peptidase SpoIIGA [Oscillospiraceae bacterium]|nr:sigma-E processing peptidase SpoIIGA [Oscillospiraceae bacterium]